VVKKQTRDIKLSKSALYQNCDERSIPPRHLLSHDLTCNPKLRVLYKREYILVLRDRTINFRESAEAHKP
jgi:hypothetical protein